MKKITKSEAIDIINKSEFILSDENENNINLIIKTKESDLKIFQYSSDPPIFAVK